MRRLSLEARGKHLAANARKLQAARLAGSYGFSAAISPHLPHSAGGKRAETGTTLRAPCPPRSLRHLRKPHRTFRLISIRRTGIASERERARTRVHSILVKAVIALDLSLSLSLSLGCYICNDRNCLAREDDAALLDLLQIARE